MRSYYLAHEGVCFIVLIVKSYGNEYRNLKINFDTNTTSDVSSSTFRKIDPDGDIEFHRFRLIWFLGALDIRNQLQMLLKMSLDSLSKFYNRPKGYIRYLYTNCSRNIKIFKY